MHFFHCLYNQPDLGPLLFYYYKYTKATYLYTKAYILYTSESKVPN